MSWLRRITPNARLALVVLTGLILGTVLHVAGIDGPAHATWAVSVAVVLVPLTWSVLQALRTGRLGVDLIALLAMAGALIAGEYLAGVVIALMLAGGNALEELAQGRASRELSALASRAPTEAHVRRGDEIVKVQALDVEPGDVVVVRTGEVVPVDGTVATGIAVLDQSALTGEPLPVSRSPGARVMSGSSNAGDPFELRATHRASDSMYASIVTLVEQALARKAPMVRMADRYSVAFLAVTLTLAAGSWIWSGDPIRALAVLVIATPCPLILAPPVALVAGTSTAARRGVIVKGGAAIERLGQVGAVLLDKTGTITLGTPTLQRVVPAIASDVDADELLRLAAAVEQMSVHSFAEAIAGAARDLGVVPIATQVVERPGHGIRGRVDGRDVAVGSRSFLVQLGVAVPEHDGDGLDGVGIALVALDGRLAGQLELADSVRDDAHELAPRLRALGATRIVMVTGDHAEAARRVAASVSIDEFHADCTPQRKLEVLAELRADVDGRSVVMVGDGVNDAPALAAADVGIAMGSAGATAASESAEAVILRGDVSLVADVIEIGTRSRRIALQSVFAGMALSTIGMLAAAAGYLPPVYGALTQEAIDLAVVLNAMRALRDPG
jgi:heavy metal translocating P-type ATPase